MQQLLADVLRFSPIFMSRIVAGQGKGPENRSEMASRYAYMEHRLVIARSISEHVCYAVQEAETPRLPDESHINRERTGSRTNVEVRREYQNEDYR
jgi:hypothetical protein